MLTAAIIGHLVGDYLLQNDWMALNKKKPSGQHVKILVADIESNLDSASMKSIHAQFVDRTGQITCTVHCLVWTLCVVLFAWWPWWTAIPLFLTHYIQDRTQIVSWWMDFYGQKQFRTGPCAPWSGIVVDNVWHIVVIWGVWLSIGCP